MDQKKNQKQWYERNRQRVLEQKRQKYHQNKTEISTKRKLDRVTCPLCPNLTFKRNYLNQHLKKRHNLVTNNLKTTSQHKSTSG